MVSQKVYQDLPNKELRLSQNFEKLGFGFHHRSETLMRRTPNITDVEGILIGHYTLRKRPTGCTVIAARKPFVALLVWIMTISTNVFGQTKQPYVCFRNTSADFGTVIQGKVIKQVFPFTNKGSGTLEILQVTPS